MPLYLGDKEVDQVFLGEKEIRQIYWGEKEIWSNAKIVNLGSGTSWDIKSITSKYPSLTVDNFYYLTMNRAVVSSSITVPGSYSYLSVMGWLNKNYDATNGSFNSWHFLDGDSLRTFDVTPVLVVDPSKLIDLGTGQTFNLKQSYPTKYANFTENNFIVSKNHTGYDYIFNHFRGEAGTWSVTVSHELEKEYDATTGVLVCRYRTIANANVSADSFNTTSNTHVYLVEKAI